MTDEFGESLVAIGRAVAVETVGRVTGHAARTVLGFIEEPDGSLLVAAGDPAAHWVANLRADPRCRIRVGDATRSCVAEELPDDERARTVVELILRYGTPSERLGVGPAFRLRPLADQAPPGAPT